jgi:hypothetical protein
VNNLPDRPRPDGEKLPARQLSSEQFEMVIRRAAELQARSAEEPGTEVMSEEEVVRIGRELGLSPANLSQALAEVRSGHPEEAGVMTRLLGEAVIDCSRTIHGSPNEVRQRMERYLVDHEYMVVLRRLPGRILFTKARGVMAAIGLSTSQLFNRSPPLGLENVDLSVQPLEEGRSYVTLATDIAGRRSGYAATGVLAGGAATGVGSLALAVAIAPPAALLALPALGIAAYATREAYASTAARVRTRLESVLDRLEHGELPRSGPRWRAGF